MSDTPLAPCGVGGFGFVPIAIDHHKIPDELRGDVARLLDSLGIANAHIDSLRARVAELEARCKLLELAGDNLDLSIACGCGVDGPCQMCRRASDSWQQAKEAKP